MLALLRGPPVILDTAMRDLVDAAIREACSYRSWPLLALNVRTNHVHVVVAADVRADRVLGTLKARATRRFAGTGSWTGSGSPWTRHGSTRILWSEDAVAGAIDDVVNGQTRSRG